MKINNNNGIAMVFTLFSIVILATLSSMFILRTVHENKMVKKELAETKSFYASTAAGQEALKQLDTLINDYMNETINNANPSSVINFASDCVSDDDGMAWLYYSVRDNNVAVLTENDDQAEYNITGAVGDSNYDFTIIITEKSDPTPNGTEAWDFPYNYRIESTATNDGSQKETILSGDFTVQVQKDSFARYALFTNSQTTQSGSNVWFTDSTNFAGPVHTNGRFNYAFNPSGTFKSLVTQQETRARFYNNGWTVLINSDHNGTRDVPVFESGFTRNVDEISLSSTSEQDDMIEQAQGGHSFSTDGVHIPNNGTSLEGGIFVKGDANITLSIDASDNAVYAITQSGATKIITVNQTTNQTSILDSVSGITTNYVGTPDGIDDVGTLIYVDGNIDSLSGTVQSETELTIASDDNISITNNVVYDAFTAGVNSPGDSNYIPPTVDGTNVLGLVSWGGNVSIATNAPDDVSIHGTILAQDGVFQVTNYNDWGVGTRGTATLLGGVITDNYGAFGQFNSSTGENGSGYGRNFVYDERMGAGTTPPYFPSLSTYIAFTDDITDKIIFQQSED